MSNSKRFAFQNSNKEKNITIDVCLNFNHFQNEKSIIQFIEDIELWSFEKDRNENSLISIIHNHLHNQNAIKDVEFYRNKSKIMVIAYSNYGTLNDDFKDSICFTNHAVPFDFVMYTMSYKIKSQHIEIPLLKENKYKLDKKLTSQYTKFKVFF